MGSASHNSAQQPALIFLRVWEALYLEVHTEIQVAGIVPEEMLFLGDKTLSLDIKQSSPPPPTPRSIFPSPESLVSSIHLRYFNLQPITNQLTN